MLSKKRQIAFEQDPVDALAQVGLLQSASEAEPLMEPARGLAVGSGEGANPTTPERVRPLAEVRVEARSDAASAPRRVHHVHVHIGQIRFRLAHEPQKEADGIPRGILQPHSRGPELLEEQAMHDQADGMAEPGVDHRTSAREVLTAKGARAEGLGVHRSPTRPRRRQAGALASRAT